MTASTPFLRNLLIYAVCVPLAVLLGYLLAQPLDITSLVLLLVVAGVIVLPFFLKYHHPFLILALNSAAVVFLLPGRPQLWTLLAVISLLISIVQKTILPGMKFLHAPGVVLPLAAFGLVTLITAELTGGISFRFMGGDTVGGRRYFDLLGAILVYFALTAKRIPPQRAGLYIGLFLLGALFSAVSSLANVMNHPVFNYIFLFFPPETMPGARAGTDLGMIRFGGLGLASVGIYSFLLARLGLKGILLEGKPLRLLAILGLGFIAMFSGYRSILILLVLVSAMQFFLEGLARTKLLPMLALIGIGTMAMVSPFLSHLPFNVQRSIAFLPVELDPMARASAEGSSEWRIKIWQELLPQVPKYLFLGKGYAMNAAELERTTTMEATAGSAGSYGTMLASDYHNGPLTVIIPLGLWGALAFLWLLWAGGRTLYFNYKYGDPSLVQYNTFLFALFLAQTTLFFAVFGSLHTDLVKFTALLGMSVSLNGGVSRPVSVARFRRVPTPSMALRSPRPAISKSL